MQKEVDVVPALRASVLGETEHAQTGMMQSDSCGDGGGYEGLEDGGRGS